MDMFGAQVRSVMSEWIPNAATHVAPVPASARDILDPLALREDGLPEPQGLYDPANEHDACGVGFVAHIEQQAFSRYRGKGLGDPAQPRSSRRGRRRSQGRRRLRHVDPTAAQVSARRCRRRDQLARKTDSTPWARCSCRAIRQARAIVEAIVEKVVAEEGQIFSGWRDVPVDSSCLGESVKPTEPVHKQLFIAPGPGITNQDDFERRLFILRKVISNTVCQLRGQRDEGLLSCIAVLAHAGL
jgi:glutamate synthase (NADPH/NADH) large chain